MDKAKKSVENLQKVIEETEVDEAQQATLDEITNHAEQFQKDPQAHHLTLRERLEDALLEFDADHQTLSDSIRLAIYDLSNAGV
jgi:type I site-specific restriction endonuclease